MTFNEYDAFTASTDTSSSSLTYPALGMCGEAGEVAEKIKKLWRNKGKTEGSQLDESEKLEIEKEVGDCLWYCSAMARRIGSSLERVAATNIAKLSDRKQRGVIKSEGDNR